ncbi:MAG: hypothetical protein PWR24_1189 [Desulfonauticus sp.]|nr:hypothetical protein [Desulfonauticus sp.]
MTESKVLIENLLQKLSEVKTFADLTQLTTSFFLELLQAKAGAFFLYQPHIKSLQAIYHMGFDSPPPQHLHFLPFRGSLSGKALAQKQIALHKIKETTDSLFAPALDFLRQERITFALYLPLYFYDKPLATINLYFLKKPQTINFKLLNNISQITSLALGSLKELERKQRELKAQNLSLKKLRQKNFLLNFVLAKNSLFTCIYFTKQKTFFPEQNWVEHFSSLASFSLEQFFNSIHKAEQEEVKKQVLSFLASEKTELTIEYRVKVKKYWYWVQESWLKESREKIILLRKDTTKEKHYTITAQLLSSIITQFKPEVSLEDYLYRIYEEINRHLKSKNFFVALVDENKDRLIFPVFIDEKDKIYEIKDISNPQTQSMTLAVIRRQKPLFLKEEHKKILQEKGILGWVGTSSKIWIGVPLIVQNKAIGALVIQDYEDPEYFTVKELKILKSISHYVALIIEHKKNLEHIHHTQKKLDAAISGGKVGLWERNLSTGKLTINQEYAQMLGYTKEELEQLKDPFWDLLHPEETSKIIANDSKLLKGETSFSETEVRLKAKDGTWRWILSRAVLGEVSEDNRPLTLVGTHIDIHKLKEAEKKEQELQQKLFQKQKLESLATLSTGIAHDFNNLLQILSNNLKKLSKELPKYHKNLDYLLQTCLRGQNLVKQIFNFLAEEKEKFILFNLSQQIEKSLDMFQELIPREITLQREIEPDLYLLGDPSLIEHALFNLLKNSKEVLSSNGLIKVKLSAQEDKVLLQVEDNGPGIPPEIQNKIFDPFFTTKAIGQGSGLGLASVYGIVKKHGGNISLHSRPGEGTTFILSFQLASGLQEPANFKQSWNQPAFTRQPLILVVEDESMILEVTRDFLEEHNFKVLTAQNGKEAVEMVSKHPHLDLVLLDLGLPGLRGEEVVEKIKNLNFQGKILPTSGYLNHPFAQNPQQYGLAGFMGKPYDLDQLLQNIYQVLQT